MLLKKTKISLIICPNYPPGTGGAATYYNFLYKKLSERNEVRLITPSGSTGKDVIPILIAKNKIYLDFKLFNAARVIYNSLAIFFTIIYLRLITKNLVILCHSGFHSVGKTFNPIWRVSKLLRIKLVFDIRDRFMTGKTRSDQRYITCIPDLVGRNIKYIPLPMNLENDLKRAKSKKIRKIKKICWIGEVIESKNIFEALKIFTLLAKYSKNYEFVIIGKNYLGEKLYSELNKIDRVHFYGNLSNKNTQKILRKCDLLLFTSVIEGMPRTILEAVANGINFIADTKLISINKSMPTGCIDNLIDIDDSDFMVKEIVKKIEGPFQFYDYDISQHSSSNVVPLYMEILK